jgi:carbonic anhydrase
MKDEKAAQAARQLGDFVSNIPFENAEPDCLAVCCSDHRFERQTRELLEHLGYSRPHVLQVPSGPVLSLPLASVFNFLSKAMDKIIEKIVELKRVNTVVCVGHSDCGAYKAGKVHLVDAAVKELTGKDVAQLQHEHLAKAARRIKLAIPSASVRAFFARVDGDMVVFDEIPVK